MNITKNNKSFNLIKTKNFCWKNYNISSYTLKNNKNKLNHKKFKYIIKKLN